jgi:carbon-monoxide dehydrogenase medium subunit
MNTPHYIEPESLDDALHIMEKHGADARVIAGGTDLILRMRDRVLAPGILVDLHLVSLNTITTDEEGLAIGAGVTLQQILEDTGIKHDYPAIHQTCTPFAGPPIRNRATVGGNIVNASPAADLAPALIAYDASVPDGHGA